MTVRACHGHVAGTGLGKAARAGEIAGESDRAVSGSSECEIGIQNQRRAEGDRTGAVLVDLRQCRSIRNKG